MAIRKSELKGRKKAAVKKGPKEGDRRYSIEFDGSEARLTYEEYRDIDYRPYYGVRDDEQEFDWEDGDEDLMNCEMTYLEGCCQVRELQAFSDAGVEEVPNVEADKLIVELNQQIDAEVRGGAIATVRARGEKVWFDAFTRSPRWQLLKQYPSRGRYGNIAIFWFSSTGRI